MNNKPINEFYFNINRIRNYYYKRLNETKNEDKLSNTSSEVEDKKIEEDEKNSFNKIEERIQIEYIKSNCDYNHNLVKDNREKSLLKNHSRPIYNIPIKKIFKRDIKEIDIDEFKYNDYERNNKKNEKLSIPVGQARKRKEDNKMPPNEKFNINKNYIKPDFPEVKKNEYKFHNIFNLQNNPNNILDYFKINEVEQKFQQLLQCGIKSLSNNENVNNYLFYMLINNSINNYNNINNYNQFNLMNNNFNYCENKTDASYLHNNIIINSLQNQNKIKKISIANNPEEYTIMLKSKTNDPSIEKIIKIEVKTYFIKNSSKVSQEVSGNSKNENIKNIINLDDIINGKEKRTVVKLEPIRQNFSCFDVSKLLDNYLKIESGKNQRIYNALYVPLCKVLGKNIGYCFVMMVRPKYVIDFYNVFNGMIFGKKICKKPCKVTWADTQGEELLDPTEDDPFRKPIIFKDIINEGDDK